MKTGLNIKQCKNAAIKLSNTAKQKSLNPPRLSRIEQSILDWENISPIIENGNKPHITTPIYESYLIEAYALGLKPEKNRLYTKLLNLNENKKLVFHPTEIEHLKEKPLEELDIITTVLTRKDKWGELIWDNQDFDLICSVPIKRLEQVSNFALETDRNGLWKYIGSNFKKLLTMDESKLHEVIMLDKTGLKSTDVLHIIDEGKIKTQDLVNTIEGAKNRFKDKTLNISFYQLKQQPGTYRLEMFSDSSENLLATYDSSMKSLSHLFFESEYKVNPSLNFEKTIKETTLPIIEKTKKHININKKSEEHRLISHILDSDIKPASKIKIFFNHIFRIDNSKTTTSSPYTSEEIMAIFDYVFGNKPFTVSHKFAKGNNIPKEFSPLDNAFKKTRLKKDAVLYRAVGPSGIKNLGKSQNVSVDIKTLSSRKTFITKGYTSTSTDKNAVFKFEKNNGVFMRFFIPKGTNCISMEDCLPEILNAKIPLAKKKRVSELITTEKEILLPMKTKYKIEKIHKIPVELERYGTTENEQRTYYILDCVLA